MHLDVELLLWRCAQDVEVVFLPCEPFENHVAIGDLEPDVDAGIPVAEGAQQPRHEVLGGTDACQPQTAFAQTPHVVRRHLESRPYVEHVAAGAIQLLTDIRELDLAPDLLEKRLLDGFGQLLDLHGDGGL